jgi:molecular chaperone GrpE
MTDARDDWVGDDPPPETGSGDFDSDQADGAEGADDATSTQDDIDAEAALLNEAWVYAEAGADPAAGASAGPEVVAERDEYRDAMFRVKADFDNYRKRVAKDHSAIIERAAEKLVGDLLPVLDACEAAIDHGSDDVQPIYKSLVDVLEKGGLERMVPEGQAFDPNLHEAVLHEAGDEGGGEIVVLDSLRTGYLWNGRVVRPAMVKVRG